MPLNSRNLRRAALKRLPRPSGSITAADRRMVLRRYPAIWSGPYAPFEPVAAGSAEGSFGAAVGTTEGSFGEDQATAEGSFGEGVLRETPTKLVAGDPGTGLYDASWQIDSRISGQTPAATMPMYDTLDHTTPSYVRNTSCWAADLDLTGISPWNSQSTATRCGTMISPRHILWSHHSSNYVDDGETIRFVTGDNTVVTRTVDTSLQISSTDIRIGVLTADVPDTIGFYKILPSDYTDVFPDRAVGAPLLVVDQEKQAVVHDVVYLGGPGSHGEPTDSTRASFYELLVSGDSGHPAFLVLDGELVLLGSHRTATSFPHLAAYISSINTAMTTLGGGYQLTTVDLSGFHDLS